MRCHLAAPGLELKDGVKVPVLHPRDAVKDGGIIKRVRVYSMSYLQKQKKKLIRHHSWNQKTSTTYRDVI